MGVAVPMSLPNYRSYFGRTVEISYGGMTVYAVVNDCGYMGAEAACSIFSGRVQGVRLRGLLCMGSSHGELPLPVGFSPRAEHRIESAADAFPSGGVGSSPLLQLIAALGVCASKRFSVFRMRARTAFLVCARGARRFALSRRDEVIIVVGFDAGDRVDGEHEQSPAAKRAADGPEHLLQRAHPR